MKKTFCFGSQTAAHSILQISLCIAKVRQSAADVKRPNHKPLWASWWWMHSSVPAPCQPSVSGISWLWVSSCVDRRWQKDGWTNSLFYRAGYNIWQAYRFPNYIYKSFLLFCCRNISVYRGSILKRQLTWQPLRSEAKASWSLSAVWL